MKTLTSQNKVKYKKFKPRRVGEIREGDIFYNSQGNLTIIQCIHGSGTRVKLESQTGTIWHDNRQEVLHRVIQGVYTNYAIEEIVSNNRLWECNKTDIENDINIIKTEKNEKNTEIRSDRRPEEKFTAIKSNCSRRIADASPPVGNTITASIKKTRTGRIEICQEAISA